MQHLRKSLVLIAVAVLVAAMAIAASRSKPVTAVAEAGQYETATLAGGCFWGLQETLRQIPGVVKTTVGYTGGSLPNPTFEQVAGGKTGHVEAVQVIFDPAKLSYETLLADFLAARNPVTNPLGTGTPHGSIIFYHDARQQQIAGRVKDAINESGDFNFPVLVDITQATVFYPAEEYNQDYYRKTAAAHACELSGN